MKYLFLLAICLIFVSGIKSQSPSNPSIQEMKELKSQVLSEGAFLSNQMNASWEEYVLDSILFYTFNSPNDSLLNTKREYLYPEEGLNIRITYNWNASTAAWHPHLRYIWAWDESGNLTEYTRQLWDEESMDWVYMYYMQMTYNNAGQEVLFIYQVWDEALGELVNYMKDENSYNDDGAHTSYWTWMWDQAGGVWTGIWHSEWIYSVPGLLELKLDYGWDEVVNDWSLEYKDEYTYDSNDFLVQTDGYNLSPVSGLWMLTNRSEYTNNSLGDPEVIIGSVSSDNGASWTLANKTEKSYDPSANEILNIQYSWNPSLQEWDFTSKSENEWDEFGNQVLRKLYIWDQALPDWKLEFLSESEYNSEGSILMAAMYSFNYELGIFVGDYKWTYSLNAAGFNMISNHFFWDLESSDWYLHEKGYYYYTVITDIPDIQPSGFNLFPNPASTEITLQIPWNGVIGYRVYSGDGSLVRHGSASGPLLNIAIGDLPDGVYFIHVENEKNKFVEKFIKR